MFLAAIYISTIMSLITLIHLFWALGGSWPGTDRNDLRDLVVGRGSQFPSKGITFFVSLVFLIMAIIPLAKIKPDLIAIPEDTVNIITSIFIAIFAARGVAGYLPVFSLGTHPKFKFYNKVLYSPICLSLAIAEMVLSLS